MAIKIQGTRVIDDNRNALNLNDVYANGDINFTSTGSIKIPSGTTAQRPTSAVSGDLRYNTDNSEFEQYDGGAWVNITPPIEKGTLTKSFTSGETTLLSLSENIQSAPIVSVEKEVPQTNITSDNWVISSDSNNFILNDTSYDTTITPSNESTDGTFTLGTGSFSDEDVGKRIVGNGGVALLTSTSGSYRIVKSFNDNSTIASGDWELLALDITGNSLSPSNIVNGGSLTNLTPTDLNVIDLEQHNFSSLSNIEGIFARGVIFKPDGLSVYIFYGLSSADFNRDRGIGIRQFSLIDPFDLSTATFTGEYVNYNTSHLNNNYNGGNTANNFAFNGDGTKFFTLFLNDQDPNDTYLEEYILSSPYDITTATAQENKELIFSFGSNAYVREISFSNDGTKMFILEGRYHTIHSWDLSTPYEPSSRSNQTQTPLESILFNQFGVDHGSNSFKFNNDGTVLYSSANDGIVRLTLSSPFDPSNFNLDQNVPRFGLNTFSFINDDETEFIGITGGQELNVYSIVELISPKNKMHSALANTSIDTNFWIDINSMTATENINGSDIFYTISTDGGNTWLIHDGTNTRKIVRNNNGVFQINTSETFENESWIDASSNDIKSILEEALETEAQGSTTGIGALSSWSYEDKEYVIPNNGDDIRDTISRFNVKPDGSKIIIVDGDGILFNIDLSTPFDIDTAGSLINLGSLNSASPQFYVIRNAIINPDGEKLIFAAPEDGNYTPRVYQYNISTPWDISTATFEKTINVSGNDPSLGVNNFGHLTFSNDGSIMYTGGGDLGLLKYNLSTPWDIGTASFVESVSLDFLNQVSSFHKRYLEFVNDGSQLIIGNEQFVGLMNLTVPYDISTVVVNDDFFFVYPGVEEAQAYAIISSKMYILNRAPWYIYQYDISDVSSRFINVMNSNTLNNISDSNHFTLGDSLDLSAIFFTSSAASSVSSLEGVTVNYDANARNEGAILGVDYEWDKPLDNVVRIKALSDENFKVRVV